MYYFAINFRKALITTFLHLYKITIDDYKKDIVGKTKGITE